jgi:G:T-mismatch repair DNA endonuclease (very short patch repair protein)
MKVRGARNQIPRDVHDALLCQADASSPKSNTGYWTDKFARNKARDADKMVRS